MRGALLSIIFNAWKRFSFCSRVARSSLAPRARLLLSSFSLLAGAHIIRHTVAITAIITATIRATTRAITATGGAATIGLGGGTGITAGTMAGGAGTAGAAEVGGMAAADAAGMAADVAGMVTIDLKSKSPFLVGLRGMTIR